MPRERLYNIQCECVQCGVTFFSSRYDAMFHSADCRQKHHRAQLKRDRLLKRIKDDMWEVLTNSTTPEAYEDALDNIQWAIERARIEVIG